MNNDTTTIERYSDYGWIYRLSILHLQHNCVVRMRCLVQNCPADEKQLKDGVTITFNLNDEVGTGRVCEGHKGLVVDNALTGYSLTPPTLVPVPAKERTINE